jgi:hypothetical protein
MEHDHYSELKLSAWFKNSVNLTGGERFVASHNAAASVVYSPDILQAVHNAKPGEKLEPISLSEDYLKAAGQLARQRIVAAGLRLGALLQGSTHL